MKFIFILFSLCFAGESAFEIYAAYNKEHKFCLGAGASIYDNIVSDVYAGTGYEIKASVNTFSDMEINIPIFLGLDFLHLIISAQMDEIHDMSWVWKKEVGARLKIDKFGLSVLHRIEDRRINCILGYSIIMQ